jgi:hypothetical protein
MVSQNPELDLYQLQAAGAVRQSQQTPFQNAMTMYPTAIITMTNPEGELKRVEDSFRGVYATESGSLVRVEEPLMNEAGIKAVMGMLRSIVNRNTIMSHLTEDDVPRIHKFYAMRLNKILFLEGKRYGILDLAPKIRISTMCLGLITSTLKRAENGGERNFWRHSIYEINMKSQGDSSGGGGLAGFVKGMIFGGKK